MIVRPVELLLRLGHLCRLRQQDIARIGLHAVPASVSAPEPRILSPPIMAAASIKADSIE